MTGHLTSLETLTNDSATVLENNKLRLRAIIQELSIEPGVCPTLIEGVRLMREERPLPRSLTLCEPGIYIIASGKKIGSVADSLFVCDPDHYLLLTMPLPLEATTEMEVREPMLGLSVRIDLEVVTELAGKMRLPPREDGVNRAAVQLCPMELPISDAAVRLLECLLSPDDSAILGPEIVREIIYHALSGPHGLTLVTMLNRSGTTSRIQAALEWIHREYAEPLIAPKMAEALDMSVSSFHHSFKEVTGSSPLQYLKAIRLHAARRHIKYDGFGTAVAAAKVGYESPSHFSRDFKRFFGYPPVRELVRKEAITGSEGAKDPYSPWSPPAAERSDSRSQRICRVSAG
jgi:AraC-like DNA-binding protein